MDSSETSFIPQLGDARPSFTTKKNVHLRRERALVSISVAPPQRPPSCVRAGSPQSHRHPSSLVSYFFSFFFLSPFIVFLLFRESHDGRADMHNDPLHFKFPIKSFDRIKRMILFFSSSVCAVCVGG